MSSETLNVIFGVYFCLFAWIVVYLPKPIAVLDLERWNAEPEPRHQAMAFVVGLVPGLNLLFLVGGCMLLRELGNLSKDYEGVEEDREDFNFVMRTLVREINDEDKKNKE